LEGDDNTKYFHLKVKGNTRRLRIHSFFSNNQVISEENEINLLATNFDKDLFGPPNNTFINMYKLVMGQLSLEDISALSSPFLMVYLSSFFKTFGT
jgi:hypothetical protein